jgi:hypothetical protein
MALPNIGLLAIFNNMNAELISYAKTRWGIDLVAFAKRNPSILKGVKTPITTQKDIDIIMKNAPSGIKLRHQLKLSNLKNVYVRKLMNSKYQYYEVVYDSLYDRPLTFTFMNSLDFFKTYIQANGDYKTQKYTQPYRIEEYNNLIPK